MIVDRRGFLRGSATAALAAGTAAVVARGPAAHATGTVFNVKAYGALGDTVRAKAGGVIAKDGKTFYSTATPGDTSTKAVITFTGADIHKVITVQGAGAGGAALVAEIDAVNVNGSVVLSKTAQTTVSSAAFSYGTDDSSKIQDAIDAAAPTGDMVYLPAAIYTIGGGANATRLTHTAAGGIAGQGGRMQGSADPVVMWGNTVLLCADEGAGLTTSGSGSYEGFCVDGNEIALLPMQNGTLNASGGVLNGGSNATYVDVWARGSADIGWAIYGTQDTTYHDCGSPQNAGVGLYIDGGASGLHFYHWEEWGNYGYAIQSASGHARAANGTGPTEDIHFHSGICDADALRPCATKVHLRNAINWSFPGMVIVGATIDDDPMSGRRGPTIDLDQTQGHGIDVSGAQLHGLVGAGNDPGEAAVQISGNRPNTATATFLKMDGVLISQGGLAVRVKGDPAPVRFSASGGWDDRCKGRPIADAGLPGVDTMFLGRVGDWKLAAAGDPWSGTVSYRWRGDGVVVLEGSLRKKAADLLAPAPIPDGVMFTLPLGYRPTSATTLNTIATSGTATVSITTLGEVSAAPSGAAPFPPDTVVYFDGLVLTAI